jgi:hypothetical protein
MQSRVEESYRVGDRVTVQDIGIGTIIDVTLDEDSKKPFYSVQTLSRITHYGSVSFTYKHIDHSRLTQFSTDQEIEYLEKIKRLA